tara:strand:+ start:1198 stop:2076 length:879 start_codon:yes stop_codon:yes gene_type:complete
MFNYNKVLNINNNSDSDSDSDIGINNSDNTNNSYCEIKEKNNNTINYSLLDNIVQHNFIDNLILDKKESINKCNIIIYRINCFNSHDYVEYYFNKGFLSLNLKTNKSLDEIFYIIEEKISKYISGVKKNQGSYEYNNEKYIFIQIRRNNDRGNWVNLWDILINKHYFGNYFNNKVIDFFNYNNCISDLKLRNEYCLKPYVLYCNIDDKYLKYIKKNNTIQYCQEDSLIKLYNSHENNYNIRVLCFIDIDSVNLTDNCGVNLQKYGFSIDKTNNCWIFKNEKELLLDITHLKI